MNDHNDNEFNKLEETNVVTEDMRLPHGSAVLQCILHRQPGEAGGFMDVRAVLVGADELDPTNPAHRWLQAIANRMEDILAEVEQAVKVERISPEQAEERLLAANDIIVDAPKPGDILTLSDGTEIVVQDESQPKADDEKAA